MKLLTAQNRILLVFVISLLALLCLASISYAQRSIYSSDLRDLVLRFLAIYSVPLGVIIPGIFGKASSGKHLGPRRAFWTAIALALIWNLLIIGRTALFTFASEDRVSSLLDFINTVATASSFLTVGALSYFFASDQGEKQASGMEHYENDTRTPGIEAK
jgi:hypothetical protein